MDGKFVVTGSDLEHDVKIWDAHTGECVKMLAGRLDNSQSFPWWYESSTL